MAKRVTWNEKDYHKLVMNLFNQTICANRFFTFLVAPKLSHYQFVNPPRA